MSLETEVRARLAADGAVAALVGTRITPILLPQAPTYPALTYQRISGPRWQVLEGPGGGETARLQIDAWAASYLAAQGLAAAVRGSLNGFIGTLATLRVAIRLDNERDDFEDAPEVYRVIQDYRIHNPE